MSNVRPFGFSTSIRGDGWKVRLPHQCGPWDIAGESGCGSSGAVTLDEAAAELARFIVEAGEALDALRDGREYGDDVRSMW